MSRSRTFIAAIVAAAFVFGASAASARPYDAKLFRLSEILGAVHYLRELCVGEDGQAWRSHMSAILASEGTSARRRALLARRFNRGYQNYSRTYRTCTVTAKAALDRFLRDAAETTDGMLRKRKTGTGGPEGAIGSDEAN
ncbi:MAG: TIGR02301 family protein [Pseudomonadota bacterium]